MGRKQPDRFKGAELIAWHARHISNPLDRLRYLRAATVQSPAADISRRWKWAVSVALAFFAISSLASLRAWRGTRFTTRPAPAPAPPAVRIVERLQAVPVPSQDVWLVDQKGEDEEYSNGLRVNTHWTVSNRPRSFPVFDARRPEAGPVAWRSLPAGIVFHTTESNQAPFEPVQNNALKTMAEGAVSHAQTKRAYNFVIDRFGRVHRVVRESDAANHAGFSVWADDRWLYLNLNDSFLGVSFEARTSRGDEPEITPAQIRSGALLTEMLRARYLIAAANCITHAQVSVNPKNMRIGYHTDWAANFPFPAMGLPDNYAVPPASLYLCGFEYDRSFLASTGARVEAAIELSDKKLNDAAAVLRMPVERYRKFLQKQYRRNVLALRKGAPEGDAS